MPVFDIPSNRLVDLTDADLRELVARLCEAERERQGGYRNEVRWGGSQTAADGGLDIVVDSVGPFAAAAPLARKNTGIQVKAADLSPAAITSEMHYGGLLRPFISALADRSGSYLIASAGANCSEVMLKRRVDAMRKAVADDPNGAALHLAFLDRNAISRWVSTHPSVAAWLRKRLTLPILTGWQPFGRWSSTPEGEADDLICKEGLVFHINQLEPIRNLPGALDEIRKLVRDGTGAVRIAGHSGIGKSRIVQALFEPVGDVPALSSSHAIYTDLGHSPDPAPIGMLEALIESRAPAILVVDNCPPDTHQALARKLAESPGTVRLITVDYDVRTDRPEETDVIRVEAEGFDIVEALLRRRRGNLSTGDARRLAELAQGNARLGFALAQAAPQTDTLSAFDDSALFDRLFWQRGERDEELARAAEALSLVYSFEVDGEEQPDELTFLGSLAELSRGAMHRHATALLDRGLVQARSRWRAVLPHALANRLARQALRSIPFQSIADGFAERPRLRRTLARRLSYLHDSEEARRIVTRWMEAGKPLHGPTPDIQVLESVCHLVPDAVLDRIAAEIASLEFSETEALHTSRRRTVLNILAAIAYDREYFDRCVALLLKMTDFKDESNDDHAARDARYKIVNFFQACFSGTHASLRQREAVLLDALRSENPARQELGLRMLCTALGGPPWTGTGMTDFGARPRDFGLEPDSEQLAEWHGRFIGIAVETGLGTDHGLAKQARSVLAQRFQGLWEQAEVRSKLVEAAGDLNARQPWLEGWREVRATIAFYYRKKTSDDAVEPIPPELAELEANLAPADLPSKIEAYVFGRGHDPWFLDDEFDGNEADKYGESILSLEEKAKQLGEAFALSGQEIASLGAGLFSADSMRCRAVFGRGLAVGSLDKPAMWEELVSALKKHGSNDFDSSILRGFVEQIDIADRALAQKFLDRCRDEPLLRRVLVELHPPGSFDENDLDRCLAVFELPEVGARMYGKLLWQDCFAALPHRKLVKLAERMPAKPDGADTLLEALLMKLHQTDSSVDTLGADFRRAGLIAATNRLLKNREDPGGDIDHLTGHSMKQVVGSALSFDGNDEQKTAWLDAIFVGVDRYGYFHAFDAAVRMTASRMPAAFLDKVFACDEEIRQKRRLFIEHGGDGDRLPLSDVDVSVLIGWCKQRNDPEAWAIVAAGVDQWDLHEETIVLSKAAIRLLEAAPDAEVVLRACAGKIEQRLPSVNRVGVMERRAEAFKNLFDHPNESISVAARRVYQEVPPLIARKKESEKCMERMNRDREQRFE